VGKQVLDKVFIELAVDKGKIPDYDGFLYAIRRGKKKTSANDCRTCRLEPQNKEKKT